MLAAPIALLVLASDGTKRLDALRHKNRVVVLFGPQTRTYKREQKEITGAGMDERDLVVLKGDAALGKRFGVDPKDFRFILVGKDGHTALSTAEFVTRKRLYGLIDAMPMRRDEMRRKGNG